MRRKWLRVAVLGACTTLAGLLLWGRLGADKDGIAEVLAGRSEVLPGRFIEVPCSEDYDSQRRFEGTRCGGDGGEGSVVTPSGSSHCGSAVTNLTSVHQDVSTIPGLAQWIKDPALLRAMVKIADASQILRCCCCGCGRLLHLQFYP